jgi:hypothetical protein
MERDIHMLGIVKSQELLLKTVKEQGGMTVDQALGFEDLDKGIWFGPQLDTLGLLEKYEWLGIVRYVPEEARFVVKRS